MVAIGNAPTALFYLLDMLRDGAPKPAAIIGMPVGFVGAAESKDALAENAYGMPFAIVRGRLGGSAMTAAARQRAGEAGPVTRLRSGRLDRRRHRARRPRAADAEGGARRWRRPMSSPISPSAATTAMRAPSSRRILRPGMIELPLLYPVTTEIDKDHADYRGAIADFYEAVGRAPSPSISTPAARSRC